MAFSITKKKLAVIGLLILAGLAVSAFSAWRSLAILGYETNHAAQWSLRVAALLFVFASFLGAVAYAIYRFNELRSSRQQLLTACLGAGLCGMVGMLANSPAGLSRVTVRLHADNVWFPHCFSACWRGSDGGAGVSVPFTLPLGPPIPASLEIESPGCPPQGSLNEILVIGGAWPDGPPLPMCEFTPTGEWRQKQMDLWFSKNQTAWLSTGSKPARLRWTGMASGPLTLLLARHERGGKATIHWNDEPALSLDLHAPKTELMGLTLPLRGTAVWQTTLPTSALAHDVFLSLGQGLRGNYKAVIQKVSASGIPGAAPREVTGDTLPSALRAGNGQTITQLPLSGVLGGKRQWCILVPPLENALLSAYLLAIGFTMAGWLALPFKPTSLAKAHIGVCSLVAALLLSEVWLERHQTPMDRYCVWPPCSRTVFKPCAEIMPGVSGESHFIINSQGMRGDEPSATDNYRLLTIGGSTTECLFLDQALTWPQLLQDRLNMNNKGIHVRVGNVAKSGLTLRENALQVNHLLPQHPEVNTILVLAGLNDLSLRLEQGDSYTQGDLPSPEAEQRLLNRAFAVLPKRNPLLPYYERSGLWHSLKRIEKDQLQNAKFDDIQVDDQAGKSYLKRRQARANAPMRAELPDLADSLSEFRRNLNTIIDLAKARHVRIIFMTQPALWREDLTDKERALLWFGRGKDNRYYSVEALLQGLSAYNEQTKAVCQQRGVECIDLAGLLPRDMTVFYDDAHFNESGAGKVAGLVAEQLSRQAPFK